MSAAPALLGPASAPSAPSPGAAGRRVVGIDLGTTHSALCSVPLAEPAPGADEPAVEPFLVPQLVGPHELERRALLPSFLYFAHPAEPALALPWDAERRAAVGEHARARGVEAPARLVSSAKSWLSHAGIDRRAPVLPQGAPDDLERVSPVEASFRYLDHLAEAWQADHPDDAAAALARQEVVIGVPASFDAAARELTVEAAYAAGFEAVTLIEEPQAALYSWIAGRGRRWRDELRVGDVILVIDVGGGTTDFSAIRVLDRDGTVELERVAVGEHILLGGDNMDLALAHLAAQKLAAQGKAVDRLQLVALTHAARAAKERLLAPAPPAAVPVVLASRGSALLGGALRTELTLDEVDATLVEGFFPLVPAEARPAQRARTGLTQVGLPYAADAAVTRHLAAFLGRHRAAAGGAGALLRPTAVLFNGGVMKAERLRARLLEALDGWLAAEGAPPVRVLPGEDLDLAVARGAAYYGLVRRGRGLRIRGGTARGYYVGIESPAPAVPGVEPPITALCVAPRGMEEGTRAELPPLELAVVVGEKVRFRFFGSTVRPLDRAGAALERWAPGELDELAPIELTLPAEGRAEGDVVPVRLDAQVTLVGTLLLEAVPLHPRHPDERWKIELSVRD